MLASVTEIDNLDCAGKVLLGEIPDPFSPAATFSSVEFSDADHGFFCNERASYNANAATEAWPLTLAYLKNYAG